jgi:hypothetical protein
MMLSTATTDPSFLFLNPSPATAIPPDKDADVVRVLKVSTRHMPDPDENLDDWSWGSLPEFGLTWIWAYEEQYVLCNERADTPIPDWLFNICLAARSMYDCDYILLDPSTAPLDVFPTYEN